MSKEKKKPTQAKINAVIARLKEMKPGVRRTSAFGDDHHRAINAQVEVLTQNLSEDDIYDRWSSVDNVKDAALEARAWIDGESDPLLDGANPAEGWTELYTPPPGHAKKDCHDLKRKGHAKKC